MNWNSKLINFSMKKADDKDSPKEQINMEKVVDESENTKKKTIARVLGLLFAFVSGFFFSISALIVKVLTSVSPFQLCIARSIGMFLPSCFTIIYNKTSTSPKERPVLLFFRSVIATAVMLFLNTSNRYLSLGDFTIISYSTPALVSVMAWIFLKETFTVFHGVSIFLSFSGVVLISRPPFLFGDNIYESEEIVIGMITICVAVILRSVDNVLTRLLKEIPVTVLLFHYGAIAAIFSAYISFSLGMINTSLLPEEWALFIAIAFTGFAGQFFFTKALQLEQAAIVSIVQSFDIVFSFFWQYLFLNIKPDLVSILGALLVASAIIMISVVKLKAASNTK